MVLVGTENDGFIHPARLLQIGCNLVRHLTDTVFDDDIIVVVGIVVNAVFDRNSENITLTFCRSPFITNVRLDVNHLVGGKEAVVDTLF